MAGLAGVGSAVRRTLWPVVAAVGLLTLALVRRNPAYSPAGASIAGVAGVLVPGWALAATGLLTWAKRPSSRSGPLLAAAGISWFATEWNNPGIGSAAAFTVGLIGYGMCPAVVAHAVLSFPSGRLDSSAERLAVGFAYASSFFLLGVLPALFLDPAAQGCSQCPRNLLQTAGSPVVQEHAARTGAALQMAWSLAMVVLAIRRLLRSSPVLRRWKWPVLVAGAGYLGFVAADSERQLIRPVLGYDAWDRRLWFAEASAIVAIGAGVALGWLRGRRTRNKIARLVVDLARSPPTGGLRDVLAETLGDDSLRLAYPLSGGGLVDARGSPLIVDGPATTLVRGGRPMAVLTHRPGLLDDPATAEEVARTAGLVLDNERLQAELSAQLQRLGASRRRIVAAADAARRRLERDLHDGAQQRLVTLLLQVRVIRSRWGPGADPNMLALAGEVETELTCAVNELRQLAHGIFPALLGDEGLAQAVEAFAEGADVPVKIACLEDVRLDPTVEAAAYFVIAESIGRSGAHTATVRMSRSSRLLRLDVELDGGDDAGGKPWILDLEDRVGAVDGRLEVLRTETGFVRIGAEIPCAL